MNVNGLIIGSIILILCLAFTALIPSVLTHASVNTQELIQTALILMGLCAPFIGAIEK
jgi:hypothetical protein